MMRKMRRRKNKIKMKIDGRKKQMRKRRKLALIYQINQMKRKWRKK